MRQMIAQNKRRSWILVLLFLVVITILGWTIAQFTQDPLSLFVVAMVFGAFSVLTSYFAGDKLVLASVGAKEIAKQDDPELFNIVENLAITAGIPMPRVYLIPDAGLNAFATGRDPKHASVAITSGLRQTLTRSELEAVMGHELSHIINYDIRLMLLAAVLVGMILFLAEMLWRIALGSNSDSKKGNILIIPALLLAFIGAPIAAQLIKLAISRRREYLADAGSVMLTRYPEAMISALEKIRQAPALRGHHQAISHLFIFPPEKTSLMQKLFSTHPPIEERIAALRKGANLSL